MEPLSPGTARTPSTGFCLLVKLCTMRLTVKQMQGLLDHVVRAVVVNSEYEYIYISICTRVMTIVHLEMI